MQRLITNSVPCFIEYYRFTPEAKAERDPFYYMPFGMGPRNCIGMRIAQMELRVATIKILQKFKVTTCEKTPVSPRLQPLCKNTYIIVVLSLNYFNVKCPNTVTLITNNDFSPTAHVRIVLK